MLEDHRIVDRNAGAARLLLSDASFFFNSNSKTKLLSKISLVFSIFIKIEHLQESTRIGRKIMAFRWARRFFNNVAKRRILYDIW